MRRNKVIGLILLLILCHLSCSVRAEQLFVKHRSSAIDTSKAKDLKELDIPYSSLVKRLLYDAEKRYLVVSLSGVFYHHCAVDEAEVVRWINSMSLGRFFNLRIKGEYDCRHGNVPSYK